MKISYQKISLNVICSPKELKQKKPIIFLHGFTGSLKDWEFVKNKLPKNLTPIFVDLIGHGKSDSPNNVEYYEADFQVKLIKNVLEYFELEKATFVGYSMGGRLALTFAMVFPEKVESLVLESTSFGIENENEREKRIKSDKKLAEQIQNSSVEDFINYWMKAPLFASLNKVDTDRIEILIKDKIYNNSIVGMKNTLLGFSTGQMKNYFQYLNDFKIKTLLVVGELDEKFVTINSKANLLLPNSELVIVKESGHNVHFEKPKEFLKFLNRFLLNMKGNK